MSSRPEDTPAGLAPAGDETTGAVIEEVTRILREGRVRPRAWKAAFAVAFASYRGNRDKMPDLRRSYFRAMLVLSALVAGMMVYLFAVASLPEALTALAAQVLYGAAVVRVTEYHLVMIRDDDGRPHDRFGIPNFLTVMRLLFVPTVVALFLLVPAYPQIATVTFVIAAITALSDWADGTLARMSGETTVFGRVYDPVVDILFNPAASVALSVVGAFPWWLTVLVLIRYLVALVGGVLLWVWNTRFTMASSIIGKLTGFAVGWAGCFAVIRLCFDPEWLTDGFQMVFFVSASLLAAANVLHHVAFGILLLRRRRRRQR